MADFRPEIFEGNLVVKASLRLVSTATWRKMFQHRSKLKISGLGG